MLNNLIKKTVYLLITLFLSSESQATINASSSAARKTYYGVLPITFQYFPALYSQDDNTDLILSLMNGLAFLNDRYQLSNPLTDSRYDLQPSAQSSQIYLGRKLFTTLLGQLLLRPIGLWILVLNHEWSGHVARAKEFGIEVAGVTIDTAFGIPTGGTTLLYVPNNPPLHPQQWALIILGGMQANTLLAQKIVWQLLKHRQPFDSVTAWAYILVSRDQFDYILLSSQLKNPIGDVFAYIDCMQKTYKEDAIQLVQLESAARLELLDPIYFFAWYSLYYSLRYGQSLQLPTILCGHFPGLGQLRILPSIGLILTPYNALESRFYFYLDTDYTLIKLSAGFEIYQPMKSKVEQNAYYLEMMIDRLFSIGKTNIGVTLAGWQQPDFLVAPHHNASMKLGGMAILHMKTGAIHSYFSFFVEVGYKTQGFVLGKPFKASPLIRGGLRLQF